MSSTLPPLTRSDVREWIEARFYERGERYHEQGRIRHVRRSDETLIAQCQGSRPNPYRVEVTLDDAGIAGSRCSCPMGGYCKHTVALLLAWIDREKDVPADATLQTELQKHDADALAGLIVKMIDRHPDLDTLVRTWTQARSGDHPGDLHTQIRSIYQSAAAREYNHYDDGYSTVASVVSDVRLFLDLADDLIDRGDLAEAATVLRLLLDEGRARYKEISDGEGALLACFNDAVDRLDSILDRTTDESLRADVLQTLTEMVIEDVHGGGYGMGDTAREVVEHRAMPEECVPLADRVRDALSEVASRPETETYQLYGLGDRSSWNPDTWRKQELGAFLLELEEDRLDDEAYLTLCREAEHYDALVERLLELDRVDDALDVVRDVPDRVVARLASPFEAHGSIGEFRELVEEQLDDSADRSLLTWLRNFARREGDLDQALSLTKRLFREHQQHVGEYETLRDVAREAGRWDAVQAEVHDRLREIGAVDTLVRLHLSDGDVGAALDLLPRVGQHSQLHLQVARAAEDAHPEESIAIYERRARRRIESRGRGNYAEAAEKLSRAKNLYHDLGRADDWRSTLDTLVDEHLHRLPAAREEFQKAGLL